MIVFPNCKINLGLRILRKRQDGYHDLETIFFPIPVTDILEIRLQRHENGEFKFIISANPINEQGPATVKIDLNLTESD